MSTEENVQIVKDFFAAMDSGDKQGLLALPAGDIEWSIPGEEWPLAGKHRGHKVTKIWEYIDTQALARASEITPSALRA